ncbi:hypothetical protein [Bacillus sp. MYb209]|uniref:hypothetical protein n=1 Tax=Bacillus sp. MYb209 TaxID=1848605 RepID=UPI0015E46F24|nr:hypothetical protein [Bacillus sp. MYb209]
MSSLEELQHELIEGQKFAMQGSYQRKLPSKKAIPYLLSARKGIPNMERLLLFYKIINLNLFSKYTLQQSEIF